jgi:hypothetical protein
MQEYYQKTKEKQLADQKARREVKRDEIKDKLKQYYKTKNGRIGMAYSRIKTGAKQRNLEVTVSLEYLRSIAPDICPVFGTTFNWEDFGEKDGKALDTSPSIDRIDSNKGYIEGNIVWISVKANRIKNNATAEELLQVYTWLNNKLKREKDQNETISPASNI